MDKVVAGLSESVPLLQRTILLPGCGHWTQQERPEEVNSAIIGFLKIIGSQIRPGLGAFDARQTTEKRNKS